MSDVCETVSAVLGLYAEGELHDARAVELVRQHLPGCVACRDALESYDSMTRTLLAGEPELLPDAGDGWINLENERRVEGVLRRLNWTSSTPRAVGSGERTRARARFAEALERSVLLERPDRSPFDLRLDDLVDAGAPRPSCGRRPGGFRRPALAAAALLGIVSVWFAFTLPGGHLEEAPGSHRLGSWDAADPPSPVLVASSDPDRHDLESPRRGRDRALGWVVGADGVAPGIRFSASNRTARSSSEPDLLYGVGYRRNASARARRDVAPPLVDAEIEWMVEVVISESPPGHYVDLSRPLYQLVPEPGFEHDASPRSARPLHEVGLWFSPSRIERRPATGGPASRLVIGGLTIYRVNVYEDIRRLELPGSDRDWTPVGWRRASSFGPQPGPLPTLTGNPLKPGDYQAPNLRF